MAARKVMIASPVHSWQVDVRFCHSMARTMKLCLQRGVDLHDYYVPGNAIIADARNDIVAAAMQFKVDDLIFIDADQDWEPEWIPQLLSYPVDCVGGPVRKKTDDRELYNVKASGGISSLQRHPTLPLLTAPDMALGTGFLRLSRKALEALWNDAEPYVVRGKPGQGRWIFDTRPMDLGAGVKELVGEDVMVSDKLRALGIPVWLDPKMVCGHFGLKNFKGDFTAWLARVEP